jgi:hypothetical protein
MSRRAKRKEKEASFCLSHRIGWLDDLYPRCNIQEKLAGPDGKILRVSYKWLNFPASLPNIQLVDRIAE